MSKLDPKPTAPTCAELELGAAHEAKALLRGDDECTCRTCKKVRAAEEKGRSA